MKNINKQILNALKITLVSVLLLCAFATVAFAQGAGAANFEYTFGDSENVIATVRSDTEITYNFVVKDVMLSISSDIDYSSALAEGKAADFKMAYSVTFTKDGARKDLDHSFNLSLRIPEAIKDKTLAIVSVDDNGVAHAINATVENGYFCFDTTTLYSNYVIVEVYDLPAPPLDLGWLIILIVVLLVLGGGAAAAYFIIVRIKDKKAAESNQNSSSENTDDSASKEPASQTANNA